MQGIMVEEGNANNFIRFEYYSDGTGTYIYSHAFRGTQQDVLLVEQISSSPISPLYMRVSRQGDHWLIKHSTDGT
jgi:hypothetical protein